MTIESNELPRRPKKVQIFGTHKDTIFMMKDQRGQQFLLDYIGDGLYELTVCVYNKKSFSDPDIKRTEYVLHVSENALKMMVKMIKECVNM